MPRRKPRWTFNTSVHGDLLCMKHELRVAHLAVLAFVKGSSRRARNRGQFQMRGNSTADGKW
jgi:hypothetical protein